VWRLYRANWPDYKGHVLVVDQLQIVNGGVAMPQNAYELIARAALEKGRRLGVPVHSANPNLAAEAAKMGVKVEPGAKMVIADQGHTPHHQGEWIGHYWIPNFGGAGFQVNGTTARTDLPAKQVP